MLNIIIEAIRELYRKVYRPPGSYGASLGAFVGIFTYRYSPLDIEVGNMGIFHILILIGWVFSCVFFFGIVTDYIVGKIKDMK